MENLSEDIEMVVRGTIRRVTYHNPENCYSVIQLNLADKAELITVVGTTKHPIVGTDLLIRGSFITHPKFGRQLSARSITVTPPGTPEGIERYISRKIKGIKGIGRGTTKRIVDAFGVESIEIITNAPDKIALLQGVGQKRAALICQAFAEKKALDDLEQYLSERGISSSNINKIIDRYQNKSAEILSNDPYILAREIKGVGFLTADAIAMNMGLKSDSPQRLKAGIYYALERAMDDGHCYLEERDLLQRARNLLELPDEIDLDEHVETLIREDYLVRKENAIFLRPLERAEDFVARFVAERCSPFENSEMNELQVRHSLQTASNDLGVTFSFEQEQAVFNALRYPLSIITGGPGCGKTTIIRALCQVYRQSKKRLLLAAPTGRAAQRMAQVCEMPASTIHRLLRFDPSKGTFMYGINQPLIADAIVIDEASMIDISLARSLFSAVPKEASIILVGDKDQLPSVGPGRVFGDLVTLREVKVSALSQLFRRREESSINSIAHMINAGMFPDIPEPDGSKKVDAYFIPRPKPDDAAATIEKLVSDQLPKKFGMTMSDITVLTPSNRGPLGTIALNLRLQEKINPSGSIDSEQELQLNDFSLRVGDRVCQRVNNYNIDEIGVFNGDVGVVHNIDKKSKTVWVELWDGRLVKYSSSEVYQLALAYAVTVHRSQGSEIPCVVLALHDSQFTLLERQLVYTAITRAKKLLIVVGSKRALAIASKRTSGSKRNSLLRERIQELLR